MRGIPSKYINKRFFHFHLLLVQWTFPCKLHNSFSVMYIFNSRNGASLLQPRLSSESSAPVSGVGASHTALSNPLTSQRLGYIIVRKPGQNLMCNTDDVQSSLIKLFIFFLYI